MIRPTIIPLSVMLVSSCAAPNIQRSETMVRPALPTSAEVEAHIRGHWDDWGQRFSRFSQVAGGPASLVAVEDVSCEYYYFTPDCSFNVTGRFVSGPVEKQKMSAQFDRNAAGEIVEVIVFYHERRR